MKKLYAGTFLVSLATLLLELVLTRIWSLTMGYHFAFMAISIAVFGATLGALTIFGFPQLFDQDHVEELLGLNAFLFAIATVINLLAQLYVPLSPHLTFWGIYSMGLIFLIAALPFYFSGICIALALTRLPDRVSQMYAADLLGANLGCISYVYVLRITDGPTAVFLAAALAGLGAVMYASGLSKSKLLKISVGFCLMIGGYVVANTVMINQPKPLFRAVRTSTGREQSVIYEKWNSISRVAVRGAESEVNYPFFWGGTSEVADTRQLMLFTDTWYATPLPHFAGDMKEVEYLKSDVTNLVYYLKKNAHVLVVGSGGGRDLLSALVFNEASVVGVEINELILDVVNRVYGEFTGHIDRDPRVTIVNDDARSFVARSHDLYDIIQVSVVNTSSGASAAHALTENSIYTIEAWKAFLERLSPQGMISCTRFLEPAFSGEVYRLAALARMALVAENIDDARAHILVVSSPGFDKGVASIIVSKEPFSKDQLALVSKIVAQKNFRIVLSPAVSTDPVLERIVSDKDFAAVTATLPVRIEPPTDDCPFFFYMFSLSNLMQWRSLQGVTIHVYNDAQVILIAVALLVSILAAICIAGPMMLLRPTEKVKNTPLFLIFFACIGLGYISIEISQMQRLTLLLGHPSFGLSTVLFSLLLGSSLGSFLTQFCRAEHLNKAAIVLQIAVIAALVGVGIYTPQVIAQFRGYEMQTRIIVVVALMFPVGVLMGMLFPIGMKLASKHHSAMTPWFWSVNGATSVSASVLAVVLAVYFGISYAFWFGVLAYAGAFVSTLLLVNARKA